MRLIDADALHKSLEEVYEHPDSMIRDSAWWFFGKLEDAPTVDAAPVVHGRWVMDGRDHCHCSECKNGRNIKTQIGWNYCPNCGTKMDLLEDGQKEEHK